MVDLSIIEGYREKAHSENASDRYAALSFALQLPGICGRCEYPFDKYKDVCYGSTLLYNAKNHRPNDKAIYCYWLSEHKNYFRSLFDKSMPFSNEIFEYLYDLRCSMTHEGHVTFINSPIIVVNENSFSGSLYTGYFLFLRLSDFCDVMFSAIKSISIDFTNDEKYNALFRRYNDCGIGSQLYTYISKFTYRAFNAFWSHYPHEYNTLSMLYDFVFRNNEEKLKIEKDKFDKDETYIFEIDDYCNCYNNIVQPDNFIFFEKEYTYALNRTYKGIVCRLNKDQFDCMNKIIKSLDKFSQTVNSDIYTHLITCINDDVDGVSRDEYVDARKDIIISNFKDWCL